jgi:thiamine-phosphate pyrophosphorylase
MYEPRFTLILPADGAAEALVAPLSAALGPRVVEAVLITGPKDEKALLARAKVLVPIIQQTGAAALIDAPDDPRLVARAGADGAHYPFGHPVLKDALATLRPQRICGIGNLRTRHEAMEAGESGADYLMFGEPRADGYVPERDRTIERAAWWAEVFNIPCVAYADGADAVAPLAATHADFIALGPWLLAGDAALHMRKAMAALTTGHET